MQSKCPDIILSSNENEIDKAEDLTTEAKYF